MLDTYPDPASRPIHLQTAFTNFFLPTGESRPESSRVIAKVDVFQPTVSCEVAHVVSWSQEWPGLTLNLTLRSPSCEIGRLEVPVCFDGWGPCLPSEQYFSLHRVPCNGAGSQNPTHRVVLDEMTVNTYQYVFIGLESELSSETISR